VADPICERPLWSVMLLNEEGDTLVPTACPLGPQGRAQRFKDRHQLPGIRNRLRLVKVSVVEVSPYA